MSETAHISVDALTKRFGAVTAVTELSLSLEAGQIVGLLGPNGAGKTTTLHTIMGLKTPTSGDVRINRVSVQSPEIASVRRAIGYLPEQPVLYDFLTGREFVQFLGQLYDAALDFDDWLTDNLDALEMGKDADRLIRTYSTGMRKKDRVSGGHGASAQHPDLRRADRLTGCARRPSGQGPDAERARSRSSRTVHDTRHGDRGAPRRSYRDSQSRQLGSGRNARRDQASAHAFRE